MERIKLICPICKKDHFRIKSGQHKLLCSRKCFDIHAIQNGHYTKMGQNSAKAQQRRSKNEVLMTELLTKAYPQYTVIPNYKVIDNWDCDIFIKELNLAILWDGQWHRIQISKKQSLKQVQNRDRIKRGLFQKQGIHILTINDYGKSNSGFVEEKLKEVQKIIQKLKKSPINVSI